MSDATGGDILSTLQPLCFRESKIRLMTRLASQYNAINLSQGIPSDSPDLDTVLAAVCAIGGGDENQGNRLRSLTLNKEALMSLLQLKDEEELTQKTLRDLLRSFRTEHDVYNQYSIPFGIPEIREVIANYYERFYGFRPCPETEITVTLGATEGISAVLRAVLKPGDGVLILEPFHEMYVNQVLVFNGICEFVKLKEIADANTKWWELDLDELNEKLALPHVRALILNSPHNPTGKVFTKAELRRLCDMCLIHNVFIVTDEIYEHIIYEQSLEPHHCLYAWEDVRNNVICGNSLSKTGSITGWRVGWIIAGRDLTDRIRCVHDTIAMQAPTPLQKGVCSLLQADKAVHERSRLDFQMKRNIMCAELESLGFEFALPQGAYYIFCRFGNVKKICNLTAHDAAEYLVKKVGVAVVPGDTFYSRDCPEKNAYLRIAFCKSLFLLRDSIQKLRALND